MSVKIALNIRTALGLNHYQMSSKLNMSQQAYRKFETQVTNPSLKSVLSLWRVAKAELGWSPDEYLAALERESSEEGH